MMSYEQWKEGDRWRKKLDRIGSRRRFREQHGCARDNCLRVVSIYELIDPRDEQPFYVGKSLDPVARLNCYLSWRTHGNLYLGIRIYDLRHVGKRPQMRIIETVKHPFWDETRALNREAFWIKRYVGLGYRMCNKAGNKRTKYRGIDRVEQPRMIAR